MEGHPNHRSPSPHTSSSARHTPSAAASPDFLQQGTPQQQHQQTFNPSSLDFTSQPLFQDQSFATADGLTATAFGQQQQQHQQQQNNNSFQNFGDFGSTSGGYDVNVPLFSTGVPATDQSFIDQAALDPALDPALLGAHISSSQSLSPPGVSDDMTTTLHAPMHHHQQHISPHGSPALGQSPFQPPPQQQQLSAHSRNNSLDPSSAAAYGPGGEWGATAHFQGHRRALSADARSDISSAQHSPYGAPLDDFNQPLDHSPHMNPQQGDPLIYQDVMGIGQVSLGGEHSPYISPAHSPAISPRLPPVQLQQQQQYNQQMDQFSLSVAQMSPGLVGGFDPTGMGGGMMGQQQQPFPSPGRESFPNLDANKNTGNIGELKSDPAMSPPEINIIIAPPSRQNTLRVPNNAQSGDALKPPERSSRMRSTSDPSSSRGSSAPGSNRDTLSPRAAGVGSRSPSPSGKSRRSSTSNVAPNRDYILDLADPNRPSSDHSAENSPGGSGGTKRGQKHPATFQCSLCPKRFTRAYNLRSHLRTHTDERPFVCSHCGKAFARQHDRKRHEGLHSGEKKFVCRGQLKDGNNWGCGRRFARADALGRHFRSEAGRLCIKPLMDEEAMERGLQAGGQHQDMNAGASAGMGMPMMAGMGQQQQQMGSMQNYMYNVGAPIDTSGMDPAAAAAAMQAQAQVQMMPQVPMRLPQALLAQYPTLSGIWDSLPANGGAGQDDLDLEGGDVDVSGRNSFSSAGELDLGDLENLDGLDDEDWNAGQQHPHGAAYGWASDVGP